jgi:hypothetical protein
VNQGVILQSPRITAEDDHAFGQLLDVKVRIDDKGLTRMVLKVKNYIIDRR